jgi:hypothetical protein
LRFGREALGAAAAAGVFHSWRVHGEKTFMACAVFVQATTLSNQCTKTVLDCSTNPKNNFCPTKNFHRKI